MKYRNVFDRRTLLRGAGGVAFALPFIEEMRSATSAVAAEDGAASRLVTLFVGNGIPPVFVKEGPVGPLAPFAEVKGKLSAFGRLDLDEPDSFAHDFGGVAVFTGTKPASRNASGGPTIDQFVLKKVYPSGVPTRLQTVSAGVFYRGIGEQPFHIHSWKDDGRKSAEPFRDPKSLWAELFSGFQPPPSNGGAKPDPRIEGLRQARLSMLDAVKSDFDHLLGERGNLGKASRAYLKDHFDRVRELETRLNGQPAPVASGQCDPGTAATMGEPYASGSKPKLTAEELMTKWKLTSDIYVMGLHCDVFRFGNLQLFASSERIFMRGKYADYPGREIEFTHGGDHHDAWYHSPEDTKPAKSEFLGFLHIVSRLLVHTIKSLDDPMYRASNGKTFWENHLVVLGCEMGRHGNSDLKGHNMRESFHFVSPAGGSLKTGLWDVQKQDRAANLYASCLRGMNVSDRIGTSSGNSMDYVLA